MPPISRPEVTTARRLRREMPLPEVLLWQELRGGRLGVKFRRQHPVGPYVADFCCLSRRFVVEIDGEAHGRADRPVRDHRRDAFFNENGFRVLRFTATEVLRDLDGVVAATKLHVDSPLHHASHGPPPRAGKEQE